MTALAKLRSWGFFIIRSSESPSFLHFLFVFLCGHPNCAYLNLGGHFTQAPTEYGSEWEDLDDSDIEDFLEDLVYDIQDYFSDDTVINGEIIDTDSGDSLLDFNKDGDDDLDVDFNDEDYRDSGSSDSDVDDLEDTLYDDYVNIEGDNGDVNVEDISLSGDEDNIKVIVEINLGNDETEWNDLSSSEIKYFIDDIVSDIQNEFSDDTEIIGEIYDINRDATLVEFDKIGNDNLFVDIL